MSTRQTVGLLILAGIGVALVSKRASAAVQPDAQPFSFASSLVPDSIGSFFSEAANMLAPASYGNIGGEPATIGYDPNAGDVSLDDMMQTGPSIFDELFGSFSAQPTAYGFDPMQNPNLQAFLAMIGYSEGATYNTLFGGGTFASYADHPRTLIKQGRYRSTAAGRYQINRPTWDSWIQPNLHLPDFSPASQDAAAVFLIKAKGALPDVLAGRFDQAVAKVRKVWASLPGAGYAQPERDLASLRAVYAQNGGQFEGSISV